MAEWHKFQGFASDLTSNTNRRPCGTPLEPPESGERHLFLGEETTVRKEGRRGHCGEGVDGAVAMCVGLLVEVAGCGQAGSTYGGMFGFHMPAQSTMKCR